MIAERLQPGDTVGIVSPSAPVEAEMEDRLEAGIAELELMGLNVKLGGSIRSKALEYAGKPQDKADDINGFFQDPEVKAIICTQGGETANTCLSLLDWESIRRHPKIFIGVSDITVLLNAIYHKTGLITFHGNDLLWGFGNDMTPYEKEAFVHFLMAGEIGLISANGPRETIRSGSAAGRLLGGNLGCLLKLAGTDYFPDFQDAILFLEEYETTPIACYSAFHHIRQMGVFDQIQGVIVGYIYGLQKEGGQGPMMEDILLRVTPSHDFPILKMNDFGHNCPNTVLPVGGGVRLDADQMTVEIISPCVH